MNTGGDFLNNKNVTIVIDGQAGSCGKGKICGYLANCDIIDLRQYFSR